MMRNSATDNPVEDTFVEKTMLHHVARAIVTTDDIFLRVCANIDRLQHHLTTVRTYDKTWPTKSIVQDRLQQLRQEASHRNNTHPAELSVNLNYKPCLKISNSQ